MTINNLTKYKSLLEIPWALFRYDLETDITIFGSLFLLPSRHCNQGL